MKFQIIVEGPSERAYVQRLMSFLESELPLDEDGFSSRLVLYPTITNDRIGGGSFNLVSRKFRDIAPANRKMPVVIWVDRDIYIRNSNHRERASSAGYANKGSLPDFNFSVMNFEDFLALHFDDEFFVRWRNAFDMRHHFEVPLHSEEYDELWQSIWKEFVSVHPDVGQGAYKKGTLPEGFITIESLKNVQRHLNDPKMAKLFAEHSSVDTPTFPVWLIGSLSRLYPDQFAIGGRGVISNNLKL